VKSGSNIEVKRSSNFYSY